MVFYKKGNKLNKILICIFLLLIFYVLLFTFKREDNFTAKDKDIEIIIARYNEGLEWVNDRQFNKNNHDITIYNKGLNFSFPKNNNIKRILNIDNLGRCDHTYLYHVIHNYDSLANVTIFLPGSSNMDEKKYHVIDIIHKVEETKNTVFLDKINDVYEDFKDFYLDTWKASSKENSLVNGEQDLTPANPRPFGNWFKKHFGDLKVSNLSYYGIFAVHKRDILQHPKSYYENFIKELEVSSNPEVGHYFERAWGAIFHPME